MVRFQIECTLPFPAADFWRIRDAPSFLSFIVQDGLLKEMRATEPVEEPDGWYSRVQQYTPADVDCPDMIRAFVGDTMFAVSDEQRWNSDERPCHLHFFIRPSFLSGLSRTYGELSIEQMYTEPPSDEDIREETLDDQSEQDAEHDIEPNLSQDMSSADSSTDVDCSDESDVELSEQTPDEFLEALPAEEKSLHVVTGETRVSILTLGWFIERAIVHNLRKFYEKYPPSVIRFRKKLYDDFAQGDTNVPVSVVIDRFLESEKKLKEKLSAVEESAESDELALSDSSDSVELKDIDTYGQAVILPEVVELK
ncbi:hypothetical protein BWQ96_09813 [Gracilariopsis chorda]|uniref:Uncharacterized protein n=1 Tax=Gracilariopsis chorda TaxID=448386 RepID=A0A2V3IH72_9FLOR|nr:hypothetical protein BWQ96_09813 [Gracilariopsis chorda]|eukprot:PXF40490.1 hypothetical protein BWQ96_09813 [Gracilariopsis chorda]